MTTAEDHDYGAGLKAWRARCRNEPWDEREIEAALVRESESATREADLILSARAGMVPTAWKELALALLEKSNRSSARVHAAVAALRRLGEEV